MVSSLIQGVSNWVDAATSIVALTGAGISTESGIPDFRGPQGVWTRDPKAERLSNIHHYMTDPDVRKLSWQGRLHHPAWQAQPNAGHRALVELERRGTLRALVTQNIDGLHQVAGHSAAADLRTKDLGPKDGPGTKHKGPGTKKTARETAKKR